MVLNPEIERGLRAEDGPLLIVDDVLTTGKTMERQRIRMGQRAKTAKGLVIFARALPPPWVQAIFTLAEGVE